MAAVLRWWERAVVEFCFTTRTSVLCVGMHRCWALETFKLEIADAEGGVVVSLQLCCQNTHIRCIVVPGIRMIDNSSSLGLGSCH